jgi:hypothetical protein
MDLYYAALANLEERSNLERFAAALWITRHGPAGCCRPCIVHRAHGTVGNDFLENHVSIDQHGLTSGKCWSNLR